MNTTRRIGKLVHWSSSKRDWLEGRGERFRLIEMIDTATHRLFARFVRHNSSVENLEVLQAYVDRWGCPLKVWTKGTSHFTAVPKKNHPAKRGLMPLTRIGYVLKELGIGWTSEASVTAQVRIGQALKRAHKQLLQGLRIVGAKTMEEANAYLEREFLPRWQAGLKLRDGSSCDVHKRPARTAIPITPSLAEPRLLEEHRTFRFNGTDYRVMDPPPSVAAPARIDVRQLSDGQIVAEIGGRRLSVVASAAKPEPVRRRRPSRSNEARPRKQWMDGFFLKRGPKVDHAIAISNASF